MNKFIIGLIVVVALAVLGAGIYFLFGSGSGATNTNTGVTTAGTGGTLPTAVVGSSTPLNGVGTNLPGYVGQASAVFGNLPTGSYLQIGTSKGTVQVNNFYALNPPVVEGNVIVIKDTADYAVTYDPSDSSFWLAITGTPFATAQSEAEQDLLATLGIGKADACKLNVTSGMVYTPGDALDGQSFPLSFCAGGAFTGN